MTYEYGVLAVAVIIIVAAPLTVFYLGRVRRNRGGYKSKPTLPVTPPETCTVPPDRVGNVLKGVYSPDRLTVFAQCAVAKGTVMGVRQEPDGDYHISLKLDAPYAPLLQAGQTTLVVEVIPADQATVKIPNVGDHITVNGPWCHDRVHDWNEIHPAWLIQIG